MDLDKLDKLNNHLTLSRYNAREADKLMTVLVEEGHSITDLARWAHVTRPTVYKMAERGRQALTEDRLPGIGN
jgi:transposase-like protein